MTYIFLYLSIPKEYLNNLAYANQPKLSNVSFCDVIINTDLDKPIPVILCDTLSMTLSELHLNKIGYDINNEELALHDKALISSLNDALSTGTINTLSEKQLHTKLKGLKTITINWRVIDDDLLKNLVDDTILNYEVGSYYLHPKERRYIKCSIVDFMNLCYSNNLMPQLREQCLRSAASYTKMDNSLLSYLGLFLMIADKLEYQCHIGMHSHQMLKAQCVEIVNTFMTLFVDLIGEDSQKMQDIIIKLLDKEFLQHN